MSLRGADKASRYSNQLNDARLAGRWTEVRELARKVAKHAPTERCLVLVANAEADFPVTAQSSANKEKLLATASSLKQYTEKGNDQETLEARATLAYVLICLRQWSDVLDIVRRDQVLSALQKDAATADPRSTLSILKSVYALGTAQTQTGATSEAETTFQSALAFLRQRAPLISRYPELGRWASLVLTQASMKTESASNEKSTITSMNKDLLKYRGWSAYPKDRSSDGKSAGAIWDAYHTLLSTILCSNIAYTGSDQQPLALCPSATPRKDLSAARVKQYEELRSVERAFDLYLTRNTAFPAAHESNAEYEVFVDRALTNWHIITTSEWSDSDLGPGGKLAYSRNVLEMLYNASEKTFHSTPVLRHLFNVHAYLGECDLAIKAFNSYTDIVGKGKARAEKTGKHEIGLDSDETVLFTAAEAVKLLCLYGERKEAEKAYEIGELITSWLQQKRPRSSSSASRDLNESSAKEIQAAESFSSPSARAAAYRAIGQSQINWARYAYETSTRTDLQQDAIHNLRHSQALSTNSGVDLETEYLLATALAETRQTRAAFDIVKKALSASNIVGPPAIIANASNQEFEDVRRKLPLWHLLVLLLSAMSEHDAALATCETVLRLVVSSARKCDSADDVESDTGVLRLPKRLKALGDAEKEAYLQIMVTESKLLMLMDNMAFVPTKNAVLMSTYEFFFGNPGPAEKSVPTSTANGSSTLPKSRSGTVKSFRHSVFGRPKSNRKSLDATTFEKPPPLPTSASRATLGQGSFAAPPSVTVTDTDGAADEKPNGAALSIRIKENQTPDALDEKRALEGQSAATQNGSEPPQLHIMHPNGQPTFTHSALPSETPAAAQMTTHSPTPLAPEELRTLPPALLPFRLPTPVFPTAYRTRYSLTIITRLWLFFAKTLLTSSAEEAGPAVKEAETWLAHLQTSTAAIAPGANAWLLRGWGLGPSVARLNADLYAVKAQIALQTSGPHAALALNEDALLWHPDHPTALPALAEILLDMHAGTTPLDQPVPDKPAPTEDDETARLSRTACRDRAYMLTASATKAQLWDSAAAWFLLARSWDVVGHADRAAECYWWVVELEDSAPVRGWGCVGGYTA